MFAFMMNANAQTGMTKATINTENKQEGFYKYYGKYDDAEKEEARLKEKLLEKLNSTWKEDRIKIYIDTKFENDAELSFIWTYYTIKRVSDTKTKTEYIYKKYFKYKYVYSKTANNTVAASPRGSWDVKIK